jgi:hypothetical protein
MAPAQKKRALLSYQILKKIKSKMILLLNAHKKKRIYSWGVLPKSQKDFLWCYGARSALHNTTCGANHRFMFAYAAKSS